jgi:peptidoglycan/LPS O-acetylase OafA/YrhL
MYEDLRGAWQWLEKAFGFKLRHSVPTGNVTHVEMAVGAAGISPRASPAESFCAAPGPRMYHIRSDQGAPALARVDGIDVLRAVAIFFVLMNHVNIRLLHAKVPYTAGLPAQLVSSLVWKGQYAVQMFFAVSGFLITTTALRRWGSLAKINVRDFYVLRFARIAPLLLLLLAVLSALHFAHFKDFVVSARTGGLGRALFAALTFHVNVLEAQRGYLPANWDILWSLSVEEVFYLGFPLLCRGLGGGRFLTVVLLGFVVLGPFARTVLAHDNEVWQEYSYLGGMDAIALGCLAAMLSFGRQWSHGVLRVLGSLGAALLLFMFGFSIFANSLGLGRSGLNMAVLALATCMIAIAASHGDWRSPRVLGAFLTMGQRSYEVYLTHMFVVFALFNFFVFGGESLASVPVLFAATIVCAAVLGDLVARYYSEPMNWILRRRWRKTVPLSPVVVAEPA